MVQDLRALKKKLEHIDGQQAVRKATAEKEAEDAIKRAYITKCEAILMSYFVSKIKIEDLWPKVQAEIKRLRDAGNFKMKEKAVVHRVIYERIVEASQSMKHT